MNFDEAHITTEIIKSYQAKLLDSVRSDVLIAGAGPSGLLAGYYLAREGMKTVIVEKNLSPGGGIWGGGMCMNEIIIQEGALEIAREIGVRIKNTGQEGLYCIDALELASALTLKAIQAGVRIFNLLCAEDVCVADQRVTGLVVNRTTVVGQLHVDPITLKAKVVLDATGHDAVIVNFLKKHGYRIFSPTGQMMGEGAMDAPAGERFVEEHTGEVYSGLYVSGMSVCAAFGGPRMGPIFGGMLLSGKKAASLILNHIKTSVVQEG
jgi:thiamine thiazole synthase